MNQAFLHQMRQLSYSMLLPMGNLMMMLLHQADQKDENNYSIQMLVSCHGVKWKVAEGVFEDWRCSPQYGAYILWGNDADEQRRTPIDYWKLSFPLQLLPDIVTWTTASLPADMQRLQKMKCWLYLESFMPQQERQKESEICGQQTMVFSQHHDLVKDIPFHATALKFY